MGEEYYWTAESKSESEDSSECEDDGESEDDKARCPAKTRLMVQMWISCFMEFMKVALFLCGAYGIRRLVWFCLLSSDSYILSLTISSSVMFLSGDDDG